MSYFLKIISGLYMVWFRYKSTTPMGPNVLHQRAIVKPLSSFTYPFF